MLSPLRNRFGIPGVISVIALVFATMGGAYAATNNGGGPGSKATASVKAKKGPRGPKGPKGDTGAAGPAGQAGAKGDTGAAGSNGKDGTDGSPGAPGTSVTSEEFGITGKDGKCVGQGGAKYVSASGPTYTCNGKNGTTGFTETLPSGKTETGTWATGSGQETQLQFVPISFTLPLEAAPELTIVWLSEGLEGAKFFEPELKEILEEGGERGCPGFDEGVPVAEPGKLCVYADSLKFLKPKGTALPLTIRSTGEPQIYTGGSKIPGPGGTGRAAGVSEVGTTLEFLCQEESFQCNGLGAWAVTAE